MIVPNEIRLILTASTLLLVAENALALPGDDYAVCLVGRAVTTLHNQPDDVVNPFFDLLDAAHALCPPPASISTVTIGEIDDYVETIVEDVARGSEIAPK